MRMLCRCRHIGSADISARHKSAFCVAFRCSLARVQRAWRNEVNPVGDTAAIAVAFSLIPNWTAQTANEKFLHAFFL